MTLEVRTAEPAERIHPNPVVLVHGAWHGAWCWDEGFMQRLADRGVEAHALSLRGHGTSPNRKSLRRTSISDYVADVRQVASTFDTPPVIVGHSMGGFVTQHYLAAGHPAAGAVLMASVPPNGVVPTTFRIARRHPGAFLRTNLTLRLWPIVATPPLAKDALFGDEMDDTRVRALHGRLQDESYRAYLDMMFRRPRPDRVTVPVLVLGAGRDRIFTVDEVEATARTYGTSAVIFEDMAHDMMLEPGWERVADTIVDWMSDQSL